MLHLSLQSSNLNFSSKKNNTLCCGDNRKCVNVMSWRQRRNGSNSLQTFLHIINTLPLSLTCSILSERRPYILLLCSPSCVLCEQCLMFRSREYINFTLFSCTYSSHICHWSLEPGNNV